MAKRKISIGIDIGTSNIRVLVAEHANDKSMPIVLGTGISESRGLRHGYIVNISEATESIRRAIADAETASKIRIRRAFVAISGLSLESSTATGSSFASRADDEITETDVQYAIESAEQNIENPANKQIIHTIPISFKLDGEEVWGDPVGMKGSHLETQILFVTCLNQHLAEFIRAVEDAGIQVDNEGIMASPIAASFVTLNKRQKTAGCMLANIGAETLSIIVFENNIPISLKVFPIGGVDITNDIALVLKIPLDEAEEIKRGNGINTYSKKKLDEIINARLSDIFEIIDAHLKKIGKRGLLPAGIIITGGSAGIPAIEDLAKTTLKLPSKIATVDLSKKTENEIHDSYWSVAYGLCILGLNEHPEESVGIIFARKTKNGVVGWIKQFLP